LERESGLREGEELFVENQKVVSLNALGAKGSQLLPQPFFGMNGENQVTLAQQALAQLRFRSRLLRLAHDAAPGCPEFANVFSHKKKLIVDSSQSTVKNYFPDSSYLSLAWHNSF
jgi:hypothetical protein